MPILILHRSASVQGAQDKYAGMANLVMQALANGNEISTPVEMKELCQATKNEMTRRGMAAAYMSSAIPDMEKAADRLIAEDESRISRMPKWPKNKDELVTGYNDTYDCFNCAHMPRKVSRTEWKVARFQVRNGIFYPIELVETVI
jgi:hypothetical protein